MSHLSKIQTRMTDTNILQETLADFKVSYTVDQDSFKEKPSIILHNHIENTEQLQAEFTWINDNYQLIADSRTWQDKIFLEHWQNKVYQKYACNTIIKEGIKAGFTSDISNLKQDNHGTIKLVLEKWM
uniref:Uncharacterized protein ycf35 n=1 Tax=Neoizziella asiatica TaxID=1077397 RepID=A0A1G4NWM3_9FLOR|nr:Hypothetical protein ycf35 [Neoizziella asiatica]SCW23091.1 Hypothetical protein ycf35 [Neoizziella asiatica]